MTSSPTTLVGKPWEILRNTHLVPGHPNTVDIYGKSGNAGGYAAQISLIDEYGVGFVLLTAEPPGSLDILYRALVGTIIPSIDEEARSQSEKYTGEWMTRGTEDTSISLSLKMDNGTGLQLTSLTRKNTDMLAGLQVVFEAEFISFRLGSLTLISGSTQRVSKPGFLHPKGKGLCPGLVIVHVRN